MGQGEKPFSGNEYAKYADKLAYNLKVISVKGSLSNEFIRYKLANREKTAPEQPQFADGQQQRKYDTVDTELNFELMYTQEAEDRKRYAKEEKRLIKNYFDRLLSGKEAEERIKLLASKYRNQKI